MPDNRPLLDTNLLLARLSVGSPEELGLLLEIAALLDELQFLAVRPLSESACCKIIDILFILVCHATDIANSATTLSLKEQSF